MVYRIDCFWAPGGRGGWKAPATEEALPPRLFFNLTSIWFPSVFRDPRIEGWRGRGENEKGGLPARGRGRRKKNAP